MAGELVGVASYEVAGSPDSAEVAFAVADQAHRRGVATLLLEHLVSAARRQGVLVFTAEVLADNAAMLKVFAGAGLRARRTQVDGLAELVFDVPGDDADPGWASYLDAVAEREGRADVASLRRVFAPESVAVIGVSRRPGSVGRSILHNIISGGYAGTVYAVNPHATEQEGVPCVASVAELPGPVDLAVVAVSATAVLTVAEECGERGVRALVVITSGLNLQLRETLLDCCRRHGMRLVGPNCLGIAAPAVSLDATFAARPPAPGAAGVAVQSGGVGSALLEQLSRLGIGVSTFASLGDKADVSGDDLLWWWEQDPATKLAILYLESFGNPRKFGHSARHIGATMPVLIVDAGRSEAGQRAAASHTAAAATSVVTREALFEQAGIIAARDIGELIDAVALLASQPVPAGGRVAVVSNAGGAAVLAADAFLEEVAAGDAVDAVLALTVPTALADVVPAACSAAISKPLVLSVLNQAEAVRLLPGPLGSRVPAYAYPRSAARALSHAAGYGARRARVPGPVPGAG